MAPAESGEAKPVLTQAELNAIADEAVTRWTEAFDLDGRIQTQLADVTFQIADLSGPTLGLASSDTILIDAEGLNPVEAFAPAGRVARDHRCRQGMPAALGKLERRRQALGCATSRGLRVQIFHRIPRNYLRGILFARLNCTVTFASCQAASVRL